MVIPKIIHTLWMDPKFPQQNKVPEVYRDNVATFRKHNPDFEHQYWNHARVLKLVEDVPELKRFRLFWLYGLGHHVERCDVARYLIMYAVGGFIADLRFVCQKSCAPLLESREIVMTHEPAQHCEPPRIYSGVMASAPKQQVWLGLLEYILKSYRYQTDRTAVCQTTGSGALTSYINKVQNPNWFVPTSWLVPYAWPVNIGERRLADGVDSVEQAFTYTTWVENRPDWNDSDQRKLPLTSHKNYIPQVAQKYCTGCVQRRI